VIIHVGCSGIRLQQPPACTCLHGAGEWRKHQEPLARLLALSAGCGGGGYYWPAGGTGGAERISYPLLGGPLASDR
jgi:hypothetical protein